MFFLWGEGGAQVGVSGCWKVTKKREKANLGERGLKVRPGRKGRTGCGR